MKRSQLKQLIKQIIRESVHDVNPEFADGTVRPMPATSVAEDNEIYLKGKFVDRGEIQLEAGLDKKLADYIANNHWDIMGEFGKDERGVFNYKTRGDRWCCAVGMLNGKPAMLNVTTTQGRLQLLVGKEITDNKQSEIKENEFDGKKSPVHNAKVSPEEEKEALEIAKKIWGDTVRTAKFHSIDCLKGKHYWVTAHVLNRTQYLCKQKDGVWIYSVGEGDRSRWVKFKDVVQEMSSTGAAAGYSTPFAFTKNKKGSPKGIEAAKKYGTIVGESPRV